CDADVEEAAFLFDVLHRRVGRARVERPRVRDEALFASEEIDDVELEALAAVERRERDDVAGVFFFLAHLEGERVEEGHEIALGRRVAPGALDALLAAAEDREESLDVAPAARGGIRRRRRPIDVLAERDRLADFARDLARLGPLDEEALAHDA